MAVIAKQRYKLDIAPKGGWVIVYASQHDNGARGIEFEINNQGKVFDIPANINVSVQGVKSNGGYFTHNCTYSGNVVTMALADDMTDVIGKAICVLKFTNSSQQKLATAKFILNVDSDSSSEGIIVDTVAEEIFNQLLNEIRAQAAVFNVNIATLQSMVGTPLIATTAAGMTNHNKIYVYTGNETGYTYGNWYYWDDTEWQSGGQYNSVPIVVDQTPISGSTNPVSSNGVYTSLGNKVDKVTGKGLSTEDYTTAEKNKLAGLTQIEVDDTLSVEGRAADAKVTGDEITQLKSDLGDIVVTNVLYSKATKVVSGTGTYVFETILTVNNPVAGTIYNFEIGGVSGTSSTVIGYIYSYDANDIRSNHMLFASSGKVSYTALSTDVRLLFTLYPSSTGPITATYEDVIVYTGSEPDKYIKPDYIRMEIDSDDIQDASISQRKLNFAEPVIPGNLFDYTSEDMCKTGYWYYGTSIGSTISAIQNSNTTHYVAVKIPVYNSTKLTFGIYPDEISKLVYWIGAVDKNMRLIAYTTINQNAPITYNIPDGAVYVLLSYNLGSANFETYLPKVMAVNGDSITHYSSYFKPYYFLNDCKANAEKPNEIAVMQSIIGTDENTVKLCLPDAYDLVVGDTFELFYKGIINAVNPDMYDVLINCSKGSAYSKRFIITPTTAENLTMTVTLYGINHNILDTKVVTLRIHNKATSPSTVKNILCVGDSLTTSGAWVVETNRRLTGNGGTPEADNLNNVNFIGTRVASGVHYEGYGGWTLNSYNTENVSFNVRVITCTHDKTEAEDQHSIYKDTNNVQWKLETIETGQIKVIAVSGEGREFPNTGTLTWVSGGVNHSDIAYTAQTQAAGNPFWNSTTEEVDFASYASNLGVSGIDFVYVLIGWNSASWNETDYKASAQTFIDNVHASYPNAKIIFIGLEIPARDGLGANYGATGIYSRYCDLMQFVFNLDQWYEDVADNNINVYHVNLAGQFDTEHNMLTATRQVNARNTETEVYQSNGVHPAYTGSMQIADAVYRDITARL